MNRPFPFEPIDPKGWLLNWFVALASHFENVASSVPVVVLTFPHADFPARRRSNRNCELDDLWLLQKFADLIRELGRFPVKAEIMMKSRTDPMFPNSDTFRRRLGRKGQLAARLLDIYPSLCELCRLPLPAGLEGTSFVPLIENPKLPWKSAAFSQHPREVPGYGYAMGYSMRTKRYRFAEWTVKETDFRALELYDHKVDPGENVNLANRPENAQLVQRLTRQLHAGWKASLPKK